MDDPFGDSSDDGEDSSESDASGDEGDDHFCYRLCRMNKKLGVELKETIG